MSSTALNRQEEALITPRARVFSCRDSSEILPILGILQKQPAPPIRISGGGACGPCGLENIVASRADAVDGSAGEIDASIDVPAHPQMISLASQIIGG